MPVTRYWSSLEEAWKATGRQPSAPGTETSAGAGNTWNLIKTEPRVRVLRLEPGAPHEPVVFKIYRTPGLLAWRTTGMVSRANREFTALMEAHRRGLPVVCPCCWMETRLAGGVKFSAIMLKFIDGRNLEQILKDKNKTTEQRVHLARDTGKLLGQLHRGGLYWATARPRNILVQSDSVNMLAFDMPYAHWHGHDLTGSESALQDLRGMLRCKNRAWRFTPQERRELLLGYCEDDEARAALLEPLAMPRSIRQSKFERIRGRSANVLSSGPRSPGSGGTYHAPDGSYHQRNSQVIGFE